MPRKKSGKKVPSKSNSSKASKILRDGKVDRSIKSMAGSALSQSKRIFTKDSAQIRNATERPGVKPPEE